MGVDAGVAAGSDVCGAVRGIHDENNPNGEGFVDFRRFGDGSGDLDAMENLCLGYRLRFWESNTGKTEVRD